MAEFSNHARTSSNKSFEILSIVHLKFVLSNLATRLIEVSSEDNFSARFSISYAFVMR